MSDNTSQTKCTAKIAEALKTDLKSPEIATELPECDRRYEEVSLSTDAVLTMYDVGGTQFMRDSNLQAFLVEQKLEWIEQALCYYMEVQDQCGELLHGLFFSLRVGFGEIMFYNEKWNLLTSDEDNTEIQHRHFKKDEEFQIKKALILRKKIPTPLVPANVRLEAKRLQEFLKTSAAATQ